MNFRINIYRIIACLLFLASTLHAEDPRTYDVCITIIEGKAKVIKNTNNVNIDKFLENHKIEEGGDRVILNRQGRITIIDIHKNSLLYNFRVIGSHQAIYRIPVKDFVDYVSGEKDWSFMPVYYVDAKTGKLLMQCPPDEK